MITVPLPIHNLALRVDFQASLAIIIFWAAAHCG